jgi:nitroreductase
MIQGKRRSGVGATVMNRLVGKVKKWSLSGPEWRSRLYLRFASDELARETTAVSAGIAKYNRRGGSTSDLYLLRRNVHMIEKGLTMQPRRDSFAADYIEATIAAYLRLAKTDGMPLLGADEELWVSSVLGEYFSATQHAQSPAIARARSTYLEQVGDSSRREHGPHVVAQRGSILPVADLLDLATSRRSVRWFSDRDVERSLVDTAVRIGAEAPTACNRQPYRFEIFDDKESVAAVAAIPMGTRGYAHQVKGLIVVIGDLSAFFDPRDRHLIYVDSCLASMGLIYGLEAQGIASCCINWPDLPEKDRAMASLLGLKAHERVVMLIAYGYPSEDGLTPFSAKRDIEVVREYRTL